ncbi:MAG: TonB-dependent receptor [Methylovulum sp.]|uniref:TonB-dependent receptor domain-containing protein n=1 Tax=Methylovulum sp. TaxID=1916980 RepID=UPI0026181A27|nr:TonB-dependent receptor [Methylovulum sp.]MDD2724371.1 TonB-dependent receptor [Methylovulum sp.]MDD5124199.1 TonB-dependent receptor [Methylovulum sp.]
MKHQNNRRQPKQEVELLLATTEMPSTLNAVVQVLINGAGRSVKLGGVAVIIAGAALLSPDTGFAEEKAVNYGLEYENSRLREELLKAKQESERLKKALTDSGNAAAIGSPSTESTTPVAVEAKPEEAATTAEAKNKDYIEEPKNLSEVVVTSRRKEEKLQEVPIPIAVITGETLRRDNIVTVQDMSRRVPNLGVTSTNVRQTSIALRGLGKNSGNESMESSVGVMVDNVWSSWVGSTWTNYVDIDHVEVLRGPQGTLQGKNSNLGLINVNTKTPSFKSGYYIDGFAGNRDSLQGKASATGTLLPGFLAYRASIFVDRRDGFVQNLDSPVTVGNVQETNALGGRVQFLFTPSDTVSARIIADRSSSTQTMSINPLMNDPATFADGTVRTSSFTTRLNRDWFDNLRHSGQPLTVTGDPRRISQNDRQVSRGDQEGVSGEINWDVGSHKLTSISAYRDSLFEPHHDGDATTADIQHISGLTVQNQQWTQELRLTSQQPGPIDYQVGLFGMRTSADTNNQRLYGADAGAFYAKTSDYKLLNADPLGRQVMRDSLNHVLQTGYLNPEVTSLAAFGQANWHITDKATLTLGLRETWEHRDNKGNNGYSGGADLSYASQDQQAAALRIQQAALGKIPIWSAPRQGFDQDSQNWLVNPSYKINQDVMVYFSVAGGQKSGAAQFSNSDGSIQNVNPEDVMDYELGIKSSWFDRKLAVNLNLYNTDVEGFQSQLQVVDTTTQSGFNTILGNINGIRLRGIELETNWLAYKGLSLFMNGSYNNAVYTDFKNAPCPAELNNSGACDQTGLQIPNAPEFTANFGADYKLPFGLGLWNDLGLQWHAFIVNSYKSRANYNASLSASGWQDAYHVTDAGLGVSSKNGQYNLDLVGRNVFDTIYLTNAAQFSSTSAPSGTYGEARYFGVHFRTSF